MILRNMVIAASLLVGAAMANAMEPKVGAIVSDTSLRTAYGKEMSIGDLRGEVIVLTYWMSDCQACADQVNTLDYYYRQRQNVGLRVIAVSVDSMNDRQLRAAFKGKLIHPATSVRGSLAPLGLPTTYIIDRNGQVRLATEKPLTIAQLNEILVPLLRQPQP